MRNRLFPIPHPSGLPAVGNALTIDTTRPTQHLMEVARTLGPIFWLDIMGKPIVFAANFALIDELCDETRFQKSVKGALRQLREAAGDALFTAFPGEPNWNKAHNVLVPAFAQKSMAAHHAFMLDVADQLVTKWSRLNPDDEVDVARDMTALTLDTIGLAGFGYRFNSFYRETDHPFVAAMVRTLETTMSLRGLPFEAFLRRTRLERRRADIAFMHSLVDRIVSERKAAGADEGRANRDLMDFMLTRPDRVTGETLDDANIRFQTITFLIAGHETTSGLLSFAIHFLLKNPDVMEKARAEADRVLGDDHAPTYGQVAALGYIRQVLKEALRLWPTAPVIGVTPIKDEILAGAYPLPARTHVVLLLPALHRDRTVWGEDPERFDPDRFTPAAEAARPANAFKAFGNGARQCIGRAFALHEAALVLGLLLQRFELIDHANYKLAVKETLTLKPEGFRIRVRSRTKARTNPARAPITSRAEPPTGTDAPG